MPSVSVLRPSAVRISSALDASCACSAMLMTSLSSVATGRERMAGCASWARPGLGDATAANRLSMMARTRRRSGIARLSVGCCGALGAFGRSRPPRSRALLLVPFLVLDKVRHLLAQGVELPVRDLVDPGLAFPIQRVGLFLHLVRALELAGLDFVVRRRRRRRGFVFRLQAYPGGLVPPRQQLHPHHRPVKARDLRRP